MSRPLSLLARTGIALALVDAGTAMAEDPFTIVIRGREITAEKVKLPFV